MELNAFKLCWYVLPCFQMVIHTTQKKKVFCKFSHDAQNMNIITFEDTVLFLSYIKSYNIHIEHGWTWYTSVNLSFQICKDLWTEISFKDLSKDPGQFIKNLCCFAMIFAAFGVSKSFATVNQRKCGIINLDCVVF